MDEYVDHDDVERSDVEFLPILIEGRKSEAFRKLIKKRRSGKGKR